MKRQARQTRSQGIDWLTTERLRNIWRNLLKDPDATRALKRLKKDGFPLGHLRPSDASFKHPNWSDYIAAIPLLPRQPAATRVHRSASSKKYWPLIRELRLFAEKLADPFCGVRISSRKDLGLRELGDLEQDIKKAAEVLDQFLFWDWSERHKNPRNTIIAALRWEIRYRTGKPHDAELNTLIDASFRAAGFAGDHYIDATALDRIERREKEGRVKATRRLHSARGRSPHL